MMDTADFLIEAAEDWETMRDQLIAARHAVGISQLELSSIIGVAPSTVWAWESGRTPPTVRRLLAWVAALGFSLRLSRRRGQ
jgi:transcriptional regulator with XRE-family HTH domain